MNLKKKCFFCNKNLEEIDYKDTETLRSFVSPHGRIFSAKRKGTCAKHQRKLTRAIKRARIIGFLAISR